MPATAIRSAMRLFGALPLPLAQAAGAIIGRLLWHLPTRMRTTTRSNIARCFPTWPAARVKRTARDSLVHSGRALADCAHVWTRPPAQSLARVRAVHGHEHLAAARAHGRGIIVATPHIGAWELAGTWFSRELDLTVLYRRPRLAALDPLLRQARRQAGMRAVATDASGIRQLHRALARGNAVGILPDQAPRGGHRVIVPFFDQPTATMTLLPRLARRNDATVIYVAMIRLPHGRGYDLHILPANPAVKCADDAAAAAAMNRDLEHCIRRFPEQYNWSYRRFRRQSPRHRGDAH